MLKCNCYICASKLVTNCYRGRIYSSVAVHIALYRCSCIYMLSVFNISAKFPTVTLPNLPSLSYWVCVWHLISTVVVDRWRVVIFTSPSITLLYHRFWSVTLKVEKWKTKQNKKKTKTKIKTSYYSLAIVHLSMWLSLIAINVVSSLSRNYNIILPH